MTGKGSHEREAMSTKSNQRVVTLSPSPALDKTYLLKSLKVREVNRAENVQSEIAGKAVNVTKALALAGVPSLSVVPLSPDDARLYSDELIISHPIQRSIRVNITILEQAGHTTKINENVGPMPKDEWQALADRAIDLAVMSRADWILIAGSVPEDENGSPLDLEPTFEKAQQKGLLVGIDTSGPTLKEAIRSGIPDLIKPNVEELAEVLGHPITSLGEILDAAAAINRTGISNTLVSLGQDGIVGVGPSGIPMHAYSSSVIARNSIGAGDASVAGFLSKVVEEPNDFESALGQAVSWGAIKVQQLGSQLEHFDSPPRVAISSSPDKAKLLSREA